MPWLELQFSAWRKKKETGQWTLCFLATARSLKRRNVRKMGEASPFRRDAGQGDRVANIFDWKHRRNGIYVSCRWTSNDRTDCIENSFNRIYVCIYIYVDYCTCTWKCNIWYASCRSENFWAAVEGFYGIQRPRYTANRFRLILAGNST